MTYKDLKIVYEDNHLLVVVKPYDVPVQADESGDPDMLSMLKQYLVETYNKPGEAYLGLVHRLDRPTGGVMVFAKTSKAAARLCQQIRDGEVEKRYLAVVEGARDTKRTSSLAISKNSPIQTRLGLFLRSAKAQNMPSSTTKCFAKRRIALFLWSILSRGADIRSECSSPTWATPLSATRSTAQRPMRTCPCGQLNFALRTR